MLQSANVRYTADINNQIKELKVINPKLEEYYKCFSMALHNVCIAASAVSSGLVVPDVWAFGTCECLFSYKMGLLSWRHSSVRFFKFYCHCSNSSSAHDAGDNMFNSKEEKS
ncbi:MULTISPECIES: hypothetical protein [spotted fever group]|uniref:Uncharacterized protein n=2 Tax=spotted fever group TaxID=114277 RepID=A0A0F3PEU0_RICRH|nr:MULTISPECIES: hypothetical protein [spotted fever group]AFB30995.1 hypothetical protein RMB_00195 [Rickettsia massiliae str. AZT80]KJV78457.1 hypothetical protein RMAECT_0699 [Rickettsia rhipicephali str. Ect]